MKKCDAVRALAVMIVAVAAACGDDEPIDPVDSGVDSDVDGGGDAALDSGGADTGEPDASMVVCPFPAPQIAGTAETDGLANAPARCGQPAHSWIRDEAVGTLSDTGEVNRYQPALLGALVEAAGVVLPRSPEEPVTAKSIRYLTQDRGGMVETTATVAYPHTRDDGDELDVLLFLHGTSGFKDGCGPSNDDSRLLAALFASFGYLVVMPDYLGLEWGEASYGALHPYLVGQATAIASIDAVRAAARMDASERGNTCAQPRVITFGGSQGGHAALWVERLMPYYARELTHLGVVATVPPADLLQEVEVSLSEVMSSSANIAAMYATMPVWYGAGDRLGEVFVPPFDTSLTAALESECTPDPFDDVAEITDLYATSFVEASQRGELATVEPWGCMAAENGLTTTSIARMSDDAPGFGVLFVLGEEDRLVDTETERDSYRTLCEAGMPLRYLECATAGHTDATLWALPEIVAFIDERAAGEAFVASECVPSAPSRCSGTR